MKNKIKKNPKFFQYNFLKKNSKGISGVVAAVLMIALVMVIAVIVWVVVRNIVQSQIGSVESCFEVYDKVTLNNRYTCYNSNTGEFQFSIKIADIDVDKVIISVSSEGSTNSYTLTNEDQQDIELTLYPSGGEIKLPKRNAGLTYVTDISTKPDLIQIAPVVNGQQCEVSDSLSEIDDCSTLA
jgi:hypothetical protein